MAEKRPIRSTARRRAEPPMPVEAFLDGYPPTMRAIADRLRTIVRRELPDAEERIQLHWRLVGYHLPVGRRTAFTAWIGPERGHVHLGFPTGVLIDEPGGPLEGRGVTKLARWLTYRALDEVDEATAVRLLRAAAGAALLPRSIARTR